LVGVDPSGNVEENPFVHIKVKTSIEEYKVDKVFDVATFRMVVEHICDPKRTIDILKRMIRPGGKVVIYTVNRWSPVTLISSCIPFSLHHPIKRILWNTEEKDTFPSVYRMNTRENLSELFADGGFTEIYFTYLDDCRMFDKFRLISFLNLHLLRFIKKLKFRYPENCLLAVYEKN
jgi:SAM-dependent methyltransferase